MGTRLTRSGFASRSRRNLGGEPLPPEDRKDVAEYLYKERQWPMEDLAKSLASATPESVRALRTATFPTWEMRTIGRTVWGARQALGARGPLLRWSNGGRPEAADLPG